LPVDETQPRDTEGGMEEEVVGSIPGALSSLLLRSGKFKTMIAAFMDEKGFIHTAAIGGSKVECVGLAAVLQDWIIGQLSEPEEEDEEEEDEDE
jgi:hypothetical protein